VPLNLLSHHGEKTSAEEKDYDPGLEEGDDMSHTYPVSEYPLGGADARVLQRKPQNPMEDV
jgi:hypothetical protein